MNTLYKNLYDTRSLFLSMRSIVLLGTTLPWLCTRQLWRWYVRNRHTHRWDRKFSERHISVRVRIEGDDVKKARFAIFSQRLFIALRLGQVKAIRSERPQVSVQAGDII